MIFLLLFLLSWQKYFCYGKLPNSTGAAEKYTTKEHIPNPLTTACNNNHDSKWSQGYSKNICLVANSV